MFLNNIEDDPRRKDITGFSKGRTIDRKSTSSLSHVSSSTSGAALAALVALAGVFSKEGLEVKGHLEDK
ncbi:hypothetical protein MRB53_016265 [Persea americana]|uniref:Uncharacterized protein n=1 Tax=Persea americana TaxID=3435 RepID=A0ACC2M1U0_PERAE|nr:hypothetical protein MRB53_016265 [Persea americana]